MGFRDFFDKIKQGLSKTRGVFSGIASLFRLRGKVDRDFLTELEKRLYLADVGTGATTEIVERVRQAFLDKEIGGDVEEFVKLQLKDLLAAPGEVWVYRDPGPTVVMVAGVNGSGKTTSIAKLAKRDGTAKGGAIFGIKQKLNLPVKFVGVGEKLEDLEPFDPDGYVEALFV